MAEIKELIFDNVGGKDENDVSRERKIKLLAWCILVLHPNPPYCRVSAILSYVPILCIGSNTLMKRYVAMSF